MVGPQVVSVQEGMEGTPGLMSNDYLFIFVPHKLQTPCDAEVIFKFDFFYLMLIHVLRYDGCSMNIY